MIRLPPLGVFPALLLLACSCEHNVYEVTLRPRTDGVERELSCWREEPSGKTPGLRAFPEEELARIAMAYNAPVPEPEARVFSFVDRFGDEQPQDIGGAGRFREFRTALGSLFVYAERFRGQEDMVACLTDKLAAVDEFVELVDGWLNVEIGKTEGWASLHGLLVGDLRADVKNLIVVTWAYGLSEADKDDDNGEEPAARALLSFCERGYFSVAELPLVMRGLAGIDDSPAELFRALRHVLANKLELNTDAAILNALAARLGAPDIEEALSSYIMESDRWRPCVARRRKEGSDGESDTSPAKALTESLAERMLPFEIGLGGNSDRLLVEVVCGVEPLATNGKWHKGAKAVRWETRIRGSNRLPTFAHASWVSVDKAGQKARFGRVLLEGDALAEYAMWRCALPEGLAHQWDAFEASLPEADDVTKAVEAFRFRDAAGSAEGDDLAKGGRELILGRLRDE